jgi:hypothetical protein
MKEQSTQALYHKLNNINKGNGHKKSMQTAQTGDISSISRQRMKNYPLKKTGEVIFHPGYHLFAFSGTL